MCTSAPNNTVNQILSKPAGDDVTVKLEQLAKAVKCHDVQNLSSIQPCFIHEMYYLQHQQIQLCACKKLTDVLTLDENLLSQLVNMAQMEDDYEKIAMEVASKNITAESFARF